MSAWHPNILNILKDDGWRPVLSVRAVLFGLELMFFAPNYEDPLPGTAREAALQLKLAPAAFQRKAAAWMRGDYVE